MIAEIIKESGEWGGPYINAFGFSAAALIALLAAYISFKKKLSVTRCRTLAVILTVASLRLVLFYNPVSWYFYYKDLEPKHLGDFTRHLTGKEYDKYRLKVTGPEYLAVGSSQIKNFRAAGEKIRIFCIAGMQPAGYWVFREYIAAQRPKNVILFLSEFDMGSPTNLRQVYDGPAQGPGICEFIWLIAKGREGYLGSSYADFIVTALMCELFPERKYSYVGQGFLNKAISFNTYTGKVDAMTNREIQRKRAAGKIKFTRTRNISAGPLEVNFSLLRDFVGRVTGQGANVIIVEGFYHPQAYTDNNRKLNRIVRERVRAMFRDNDKVRYIQKDVFKELGAGEYYDDRHLTDEGADKFMRIFSAVCPIMGPTGSR